MDDKPPSAYAWLQKNLMFVFGTHEIAHLCQALEELNIKQKYWKDLLTDEAFTRKDIITLQDPMNLQVSLRYVTVLGTTVAVYVSIHALHTVHLWSTMILALHALYESMFHTQYWMPALHGVFSNILLSNFWPGLSEVNSAHSTVCKSFQLSKVLQLMLYKNSLAVSLKIGQMVELFCFCLQGEKSSRRKSRTIRCSLTSRERLDSYWHAFRHGMWSNLTMWKMT